MIDCLGRMAFDVEKPAKSSKTGFGDGFCRSEKPAALPSMYLMQIRPAVVIVGLRTSGTLCGRLRDRSER